jgi:putative ribosome biogenesis GTPase RsgA
MEIKTKKILFLGKAGQGKSTLINAALGTSVNQTKGGAKSITNGITS